MRILYPSHMYPPVDNRVMWSACWATHREINSDKDISWYWAELNQTNKHDLSGESGTQTHTALCFPTVSDCTSYTANEHEVHENTPKFGFSKSPYHLCFFFFFVLQQTPTFSNSSGGSSPPPHAPTPCRLQLQSFHCISPHEYANCAILCQLCDVSEGTDIVPIKKMEMSTTVLWQKRYDSKKNGECQTFFFIHLWITWLYPFLSISLSWVYFRQ